ncbi:uncharacterized protein LOC103315588 isoform X2 [Nasonia vitripennis]|uniref:SCP domain-containing protein n=1 Tax=Nasonia vitripennis TaxID=7425 RepID=A0A7M7H4A7_NASVI|nr:uncharacterized protein LOC103315588 isoform X2 [Nasonia vitripennis]
MADSQFAEECLKHHNTLRALHNSPDLVIDIKLNDFAQDWALTLAGKDIFEHRKENNYGENLYVGYNSDPEWKLDPQVPVQSWYDEISAYKFGEPRPKNIAAVGHFTQLVWKGSEKLGVGRAVSKTGKVYVVCNYEPAGNVVGQFANNVTAPKAAGTEAAEQRSETTTTAAASGIVELAQITAEELRAWSTWLTKVAEIAEREWHEWLLAHINLALRLNECLLRARQEIESEKLQEAEEDTGNDVERADASAEPMEDEKSEVVSYVYEEAEDKVVSDKEPETQEEPNNSNGGGGSSYVGIEKTHENVEQKEAEDKNTESLVSIGIVPTAAAVAAELAATNVDDDDSQEKEAKIIPVPRDESEMLEIIKEFRRRAKRYQSLYRYWLETADRVIEEITGKSSERAQTHEEIPRFFYLRNQPDDVDVGIESDDEDDGEEIARSSRERITCNKLHLFFNLTDDSDETENSSYEI